MNRHYDYIIAGGGGAGLSLAYHLAGSSLRDKKILIVERQPKNINDRTWCFWEEGEGAFESVVHHRWPQIFFSANGFSKKLDLAPFQYKMIRGIDFYNHVFKKIAPISNIEVRYENIQSLKDSPTVATVVTDQNVYHGDYVFSSILPGNQDFSTYNYLLQHFKGWVIRTEQAAFDPQVATFMDFDFPQEGEVRFFYVLPVNEREALVEIAIFSSSIWQGERYEEALQKYISQKITQGKFEILDEEFGIIPMTDYPFQRHDGHRLIHIGTAGGQVQASTGFAFKNMQTHAAAIVEALENGRPPKTLTPGFQKRYDWYDRIFLNVMTHRRLESSRIFADFFQKNQTADVFRFLNRSLPFPADLKLISSLPFAPFLKALVDEVF